jgi:hypothetical protein
LILMLVLRLVNFMSHDSWFMIRGGLSHILISLTSSFPYEFPGAVNSFTCPNALILTLNVILYLDCENHWNGHFIESLIEIILDPWILAETFNECLWNNSNSNSHLSSRSYHHHRCEFTVRTMKMSSKVAHLIQIPNNSLRIANLDAFL